MKSRRWPDFTLLWQAALVVLPVAILSGVALYYLREDKASIEQEARDRAGVLAPELARRLGERVGEALKSQPALPEGVILDGRIQSPPDYARLPEPPDWPDRLTPSEAALWKAAQEAGFQEQDAEAARKALTLLKASGASAAARVNAEYGLLLLESKGAATPGFLQQCVDFAKRAGGAQTESGAPLGDLALLLALRRSLPGRAPDGLLAEPKPAFEDL